MEKASLTSLGSHCQTSKPGVFKDCFVSSERVYLIKLKGVTLSRNKLAKLGIFFPGRISQNHFQKQKGIFRVISSEISHWGGGAFLEGSLQVLALRWLND